MTTLRPVRTKTTISPWGDQARDLPVLAEPLTSWWRRGAATIRAEVVEEGERAGDTLWFADDLWFAPKLVEDFVAAARARGESVALGVTDDVLLDFTVALQRVAVRDDPAATVFPLVWTPAGAPPIADIDAACRDLPILVVDQKVKPYEQKVHKILDERGVILAPLTSRGIVRLGHWFHLLRANQVALLGHMMDVFEEQKLRVLWAVIRAMSINKWRVMAKLSTFGKNCDIHPTAIVEASTLGDNVTVGAGAVVRLSHLADDTTVSDQAHVVGCVLGKEASVSRKGILMFCVLMEGANTGHYGHQACVIGRDSLMGGETLLADYMPGGHVRVMHDGELADVGTRFLGTAVGHDCLMLMGVRVNPGREIPNGLHILGPSRDVISRVPGGLPTRTPLLSDDGELVLPDTRKSRALAEPEEAS